jgi:hypothetical protein
MKLNRIGWLLLLCLGLAAGVRAEDVTETADTAAADDNSPMVEVVDVPTADILDPMTYATTFRFYDDGGLASRLVIGPLKRVNLGITFDAQRLLGAGDPHMTAPKVYFKLKMFDGTDFLPALAVGYDDQGYLYRDNIRQFLHREKGLYLVGSHAIFVQQLELHAGANVYEFDEDSRVFGFVGATCKLTQNFALLAEYDNIRNGPENRVNLGGRYWIAPYFNVDFAARNVGRGVDRGGERILRLNYVGHFPF